MTLKTIVKSLAIFAVAGGVAIQSAQAKDLRLAPGVPPAHPAHTPLYTEFVPALAEESDGRLGGQIMGTEIASLGNMRTALRSGLVEAGLLLPAYFPADLPNFNLIGDMALLGTNSYAMNGAVTEYIATCDACQAELKQMGIVYTSTHTTDVYHLLTNKPVTTVEDLQGMRLRVGGSQYSRWLEAMGGTPTSTPVGETFESLSQGVIDGSIASSADIISFRLEDAIDYLTYIGLGTFHSTISHATGQPAWNSLSAEDREAVARASTRASALATQRWAYEMPAEADQVARDSGIEILEADESLHEATRNFAEKDLVYAAEQAESRYGVSDAAAKLERFQELVEKWNGIIEEIGEDPEAVAEAINREVWNEVDFTNYGT
ncbi:C4-dicarboxylate TRAP transporter substrate-binding protein [Halomonas korlensis]|uniref:TRAP-type C4-dicarboxylate transport system, substrate-binding protein n=1 Tax=Halomonas korlensis TaxID=463301 RepID=A0A1I7J953_9GAMM|nr:C4-dicarboxylate TRAP transporter substrate-binding protein [Halomonas korlensis]SFU81730.1 TRAP-type C4-dicarboxylate transport system, substrate-binding protein [Halomonas korlensis]